MAIPRSISTPTTSTSSSKTSAPPDFEQDWINFIVAYRQAGPSGGGGGGGTTIGWRHGACREARGWRKHRPHAGSGELNMDLQPQTTDRQRPRSGRGAGAIHILGGSGGKSTLNSPFTEADVASYLPQLMDYATVNPAATIPGRININQCSPTVLTGIPGMTSDIVEQDPRPADDRFDQRRSRPPLRNVAADRRHRHAAANEGADAVHQRRRQRLSVPDSRIFPGRTGLQPSRGRFRRYQPPAADSIVERSDSSGPRLLAGHAGGELFAVSATK